MRTHLFGSLGQAVRSRAQGCDISWLGVTQAEAFMLSGLADGTPDLALEGKTGTRVSGLGAAEG